MGVNPCGVMLSFAGKIAVFVDSRTRGGVKMTGKNDASYRFYTLRIVSFFSAFRKRFLKIFLSRYGSTFLSLTHFDADNMLNIRQRRNFGISKSKVKFDDFTCNNK